MTDRAGFLAKLADILTDLCVYYGIAGVLIASRDVWGVHLGWFLLWAAACTFLFAAFLKKPRSVGLLTAATAGLGLLGFGLFWLVSTTPMRFGYGFLLAVGAGMAVGLPLYWALHRPEVHKHLTRLDVLILTLGGLLLAREALGIDAGTVALMTGALLLDAAAAVGLRMSDGGPEEGPNALRASLVALGAAAGLALVIALLTLAFSRSGAVTGELLRGIGRLLTALGRGIERFFRALTSLIPTRPERYDALELEEMPSIADLELDGASGEMPINGGAVALALAALALLAAVLLAMRFRRRAVRGTNGAVSPSSMAVRRTGGTASALWQRLRERLGFAWTAFVNRNTPGGLLLLAEKRARRARAPRQPGETMRHFLKRADPGGGLRSLADALDREYYGGAGSGLDAGQCRALRRHIRKTIRRAGSPGV